MQTQISTKIVALGAALMVNTAMIGGVAYLFSGQIHQQQSVAFAQTASVSTAPRAG